ncbi:hypothetical protein MRB53_038856 [Persea americana]|nr:hypothetical protein MRB53_038856 [Persea americana]
MSFIKARVPQNTNSGAGPQSNYTISGGTYVNQYNGETTVYEGARTGSLRPLNIIPYPRDEKFVERAELETLTKRLSSDNRRVAIAGLGGIGKTQLAIEYCYQLKERSPDTWILWIHASSAERYDQGLRALADDLQLPGREEKDADIHQLVRLWLLNAEKRWLIVLDNVDVAEFLIETPTSSKKSRLQYIPTNGSVLITSRRFKVAEKLVDKQDLIELGLNKDHAIALLQSKLGEGNDAVVVKELARTLEFMPLAISQAAAYMFTKATRCSPDQYLAKLKEDEQSMSRLLDVESEELRRDALEANNSILKTWQISFEHIYAARQSAANLLSLMSFYDYQGIPEELVRGNIDTGEPEQPSDDNIITGIAAAEDTNAASREEADTFEEDVSTLQDYTFITRAPGQAVLEMHRLVQLAAQLWLKKKKKQYERWEGQSLRRLDHLFPWPEYESWVTCHYAWKQGLYVDAEIAARQSLAVREEKLTDADGRTLNSLNALAMALTDQGKHEEARKMFERGSKAGKMALGMEDAVVLVMMNNLARTYTAQGRLAEAEALQVEVLEIRKRVLAAEHPETLTSMSNLASTYLGQGRLAEAEALQLEVLEIMKRVLGAEHPHTLTSMNNLAWTYREQGRLAEAEVLQVEVLEISKRVVGAEHPNTLTSMGNLASTHRGQGRLAEAEALQLEVLDIMKRTIGTEHPDTLTSMNNLAATYFSQREFKQAQELMSVCVEVRIRRLGASHPSTRESVLWLEGIQIAMDKSEKEEVITTTKNLDTAFDDQSRDKRSNVISSVEQHIQKVRADSANRNAVNLFTVERSAQSAIYSVRNQRYQQLIKSEQDVEAIWKYCRSPTQCTADRPHIGLLSRQEWNLVGAARIGGHELPEALDQQDRLRKYIVCCFSPHHGECDV